MTRTRCRCAPRPFGKLTGIEVRPQLRRQPKRTPLPRALQGHSSLRRTQIAFNSVGGHRASGKQYDLPGPILVLHLDGLAPGFALTGVDLTKVQHLALHDAPITQAPILHHAPVLVGLAVLQSSIAAQEHARIL